MKANAIDDQTVRCESGFLLFVAEWFLSHRFYGLAFYIYLNGEKKKNEETKHKNEIIKTLYIIRHIRCTLQFCFIRGYYVSVHKRVILVKINNELPVYISFEGISMCIAVFQCGGNL